MIKISQLILSLRFDCVAVKEIRKQVKKTVIGWNRRLVIDLFYVVGKLSAHRHYRRHNATVWWYMRSCVEEKWQKAHL